MTESIGASAKKRRGAGSRSFFATAGSGKGVDLAQARVEMRMNMLTGALPNAVNIIGSQGMLELAASEYDDTDMMEEAVGLIGFTNLKARVSELGDMNDEEQWGQFNSMNPTVRDALRKAGWNPTEPGQGGGWGGFLKALPARTNPIGAFAMGLGWNPTGEENTDAPITAGGPVGAAMGAVKAVGSGAKWGVMKGLGALAYPAEEVGRLGRVAPIMDAQADVLAQTGETAAQFQQRTGIDVSNASATGGMVGDMAPVGPFRDPRELLNVVMNPTDIWGAVRTWKEIGHSGADDYLATVQYEIYQDLEDENPGAGKDMLRYVKAFAAGRDLNEVAEEEGVSPNNRQAFVDRLAALRDTDLFKQAVNRLESGRVSVGRTVARQLHHDMDSDVSSGGDKLLSGTVDLAFGVIMDPTLAGGKLVKIARGTRWATGGGPSLELNKATKIVKWVTKSEDFPTLDRWQRMVDVVEDTDTIEDAAKALADLPGRGWRAMRFGTHQRRLASEAAAVHAPAKAVSEFYRTGDAATLIRKYPAFEASISDMNRYHRYLIEAGEEGLTKPANVIGFYKWILGERETVAKIGADAVKPSMKLFGMNGLGHTMVPHATAIQRGRMKTKLALSAALHTPFNERLSKESLDALAEHGKEVADSIDEAADLSEPALVKQDILIAEAASEDEAVSTLARAELAVRNVAEELDEKHVDPETLGFVLRSGDYVREQFSRFVRTVTTKVPKRGFVDISDDGDPEDFRNFVQSLGLLTHTPKALIDQKYNQFVAAPAAVKHAMVNKVIYDAADASGLLDTAEGKEIIRRHIAKVNQLYGVNDLVRHSIDDTRAAVFQVHQAIHEGQLAGHVSIPSFKEWMVATGAVARQTNLMRWSAGHVRNSHVEAMTTKVWKPAVMFGLGFGLRAGSDEALTFIGRVGLSHYGRQAFLDRWAGLRDETGKLVLRKDGSVLREPQAAIAPMRWVVNSVAHIAGVTDDVLEAKAKNLALEDAAWSTADEVSRLKILEDSRQAVKSNLRILPKTLRGIDLAAKQSALWSSKAVHKLAGERKYLSRGELAAWILKHDSDYAERVKNARIAMRSPFFRDAVARSQGHVLTEMADFDQANNVAGRTVDVAADTPSGVRAVRIDYKGDWDWVSDNDLGLKAHHYEHQIKSMAANPSPRAAMAQWGNEVPQSVIDEVSKAFRDVIDGAQGVDAVRAARKYIAEKANAEGGGEAVALMRQAKISQRARALLTANIDDRMLTDNVDAITDRAFNAALNALRSRENSGNLRAMVAASTMDGKLPMVPLKQGHDRWYFPAIDRRSAEALVNLLPNRGQAEQFATLLVENLKRISATREAGPLFDSFAPQQGFDMATWMAGMKATLAQNEGNYIPAGLAASTNPRLAEALRDTIAELIPSPTLQPRLGFIDHPSDAVDVRYGMLAHPGSKSVVNLAPYQTAGMQTIDPDTARRVVHAEIQRPGQRPERYWLGEEEIADVAGVRGRAESMKVKKVSRTNTFTKIGRNKVLVNKKLIDADFDAGMPFLRGEGGTMRVTSKAWKFPPEMEQRADELAAVLDSHGLGYDTGIDLEDLVTERRKNYNAPIPFESEMADNRLLDEFNEVAAAAVPAGQRVVQELDDEVTRFSSPIVKEAMDRLGLSADEITDRREYLDLLTERARAHAVLDAAGEYAPRVVTEEAVNREMDALAYAWNEAGLAPNEKVAARLTMNSDTGDYKVLGEVWASGFTEEAAVRRAAQNIAEEVRRTIHGAKSGEPLHELIHPLLAGQHTTDRFIRSDFPMDELPAKVFGPKEIVGSEVGLTKVVQRLYQGVAEPAITAISRGPMMQHSFHVRMQANNHIRDRLINKDVDAKARAALGRIAVDPNDLDIVNENLLAELKIDKNFGVGAEDELTEYARAIVNGDDEGMIDFLAGKAADQMNFANDAARVKAMPSIRADIGKDIKTIRGWHLNQNEALEVQVRRATSEALDMVIPFVDDHRVRSAFQEYIGPVFMPFFYAEEQFLRRLAKGVYENPNMVRKAQLTIHGMETMGMIRDNERGQRMLVIPGTDVLWESVGWVAAEVTGNDMYRVDVDPFGLRLDYVLPGWNISESRFGFGPLVGIAADQLTARFPEAEWAGRRDNGQMIDYLLPSKLIAGWKLFAGDPKEIGTAEVSAIGMLEQAGFGPPENATAFEKEQYLSDVRNMTRAVGGMRLATGLFTLGSVQPLDIAARNRAEYMQLLAEGVSHDQAKRVLIKRHSTSEEEAPFSQEMMDLLGEGLSNEEALMAMLERHGPNGLIWTVFGSENQVGAPLPANEATWEFMLDNEELITDHPETMAWLFPQMKDGDEFDFRAYNEQSAMGLREKRTPEEFLNQLYVAQGRPGYFAMTDRHEEERELLKQQKAPQEEKDALEVMHRAERQAYLNQHPAVKESMTPEASERRKKVLRDLPVLIKGGVGGEQGEALKPLLERYQAFRMEYESFKSQSSKAARAHKKKLADEFYTDGLMLVRGNPQLSAFFNSVIRPEMPDNADTEQEAA